MSRSFIRVASVLLAAAVLLSPGPTFAQSTVAEPKASRDGKAPRQRATTPLDRPVAARPRQMTSCAQFGAGFVRLPGSDSCVHVGGGIDVGVGGSR